MAIGDYMEMSDAHLAQKAKDELLDYIVRLEQTLDQAVAYGKKGDIRMLTILGELNTVDEDLTYYCKRANEMKPIRDYHHEIGKLIREYLPVILKKELEDIEAELALNPDETEDATARLEQLNHIIQFYGELYPEIDGTPWSKKISAINARFSEQIN